MFLGHGNDTGLGGTGNDTLDGGLGADQLFGEAGHDRLLGRDGSDLLVGGIGVDRLEGGLGKDRLNGGTGNDTMPGNAGADWFILLKGDGIDRITDFNVALDLIDLPLGLGLITVASTPLNSLVSYGALGDQVLLVGIGEAEAALLQFV